MSESWKIDPSNGDYIMEGGSPVPSESLTLPAYYRLKTQRGKWLYAPDPNYGSDYYLVKKRFNGADLSRLQNIGERALQPLIDDNRASEIEIVPDTEQRPNRFNAFLSFQITDAQGEVEKISLPPLGGE